MDLKQLKQLWREHGFRSSKRLGQNFLIDKNIRDKILDSFFLKDDDIVVEIGAGFGTMSFAAADRCGKLFAIEKDDRIYEMMAPLFREKNNLELIRADILDVDICALAGGKGRVTVFGNIPYYISTPIIEKIIEQRRCIDAAHIVMQDELVRRIVSAPGSKEYGSISCFVQYHTGAERVFKITKNSFYPRPQVDSCLLRLKILDRPSVRVRNEKLMFEIIRKAFSQRRKKAINPLSDGAIMSIDRVKWMEIFKGCDIDDSSRAEDLSLADYARIADAVEARV